MKNVIALERGHDGISLREAGATWPVADDALDKDGKPVDGSTWYCAADKAPAAVVDTDRPPPGSGPKRGSRAQ